MTKPAFSTLEMMIALALALMIISAVFQNSFGFQSEILTSQTNNEAVGISQQLLENEQATAKTNFAGVSSVGPMTNGIYTTSVTVTPSPDQLTKTVTALVSWLGDHNQPLFVKLATLVTNPSAATDKCSDTLTGDWANPQAFAYDSAQDLVAQATGNTSNGLGIADAKVYHQKLYIAADYTANDSNTFYVFSLAADPTQKPTYLGRAQTVGGTSASLAAVAVAPSGNKLYAYVASAVPTSKSTCGNGVSCPQFQVIDVTPDAAGNVNPTVVPTGTLTMPVTSANNSSQGVGRSIFYDKGYVYLGLVKPQGGDELHIIDVGGGTGSPTSPKRVGGYTAGGSAARTITSIYVKDNYAYLTTDDNAGGNKQLAILNISTKNLDPLPVAGYFTAPGIGYGRAVHVDEDSIYFGRSYSSSPNFYLFDNTKLPLPSQSLTPLGSKNTAGSDSVDGLTVRNGSLAFLLINNTDLSQSRFQIFDVSQQNNNITPYASIPLQSIVADLQGNGQNFSGSSALNCTGNYFYVSLQTNGNNKDILAIIGPGGVTPTVNLAVHDAAHNPIITATAGDTVHGSTSVSGSVGTPAGTATFTFYTSKDCSTGSSSAGTVSLVNGVADPSTFEGPLAVGSYSFKAHYSGNFQYNAANSSCAQLTVIKATPTITWSNPSDITYGTALSATQLNATASVPGTFTYTPASGTVLNAGANQTLSVHFVPTDITDYNIPPDKVVSINVNQAASVTTVSCPASVTYNGSAQTPCTATVTGAGGLSLTPTPTYINNVNAGTATASYTYAGDTNHTGSSDSKTFTINKANQTITVTTHAPASAAYNSTFTVAATGGGSGNSVVITTTGGCSGSGNNSATVTMTSTVTSCVAHYNQSGNANYNAAPEITETTIVSFNYALSNSGNIAIPQKQSGSVTITRTLLAGATQGVTLTVTSPNPLPKQVAVSYSNQTGNPGNPCTGTCLGVVTIGTGQQTPTGTPFTFVVTGTSSGTPDKTTTFTVTVQ